ncbi:UDP-N-acetylglucosamine--LPS N-acetylglucosamine transferase [Paenibacillus albiflavus]|uniref:UDP-N-acetylglucosamine--LPS N-acetylglucosamine transferase n=1 Tax=Paenibacillus albiflavus TaxID=2545760 RepID=A0A4R4E4W9_9BACL|nr:UDP-N-acetylglucosamine--LPS N-acetylglucosamine transferase [Paenibacillus albiflavus]
MLQYRYKKGNVDLIKLGTRLGEISLRKKRILLLSEGFGAGHTQAAQALSVSLRQYYPGLTTRVIELGAFLHPTLFPWIFNAYRRTVSTKPHLYGKLYRFQYMKSLNPLTQLALHRILYSQTDEVIRQLRPDVIVCTHPFPNLVVSRLKKSGLSIPLCTVITDYDAHGTWVSSEVNRYMVSTAEVKQKLVNRGIPADRIQITGIPIHPSFWQHNNREEIRLQYGLKRMPTVLVMGGGWGLFDNDLFMDDLIKWREHIQLIICLGRNERTLQQLSNDPRFQHPHIKLLGFTKEIDKLMDVSHLLITKPGGITCTEGLVKGIPMLFYKPIPGQEEENMQYFLDQGFGEPIISGQTIDVRMRQMILEFASDQEIDGIRPSLQSNPDDNYDPRSCSQAIIELLN